jgi:hypothetical protein
VGVVVESSTVEYMYMILCDSWPHRGANHFALQCG